MHEIDFYNKVKIIDEAIASGQISPAIIDLIKSKTYSDYFFKRATTIEWFDILNNEGYFKPENNPRPAPADQEGSFTIPEWNVLPYLEKISEQVSIPRNEQYIEKLLAIIKDVSNYKDAEDKHIDNYRTWWYFVKILINLPTEKIPDAIIDLIPIWFDSRFDTTLPGSDISIKLLPKFLSDAATPEDIQKAEKIIDYITAIKTVQIIDDRPESHGTKEEARLGIDSYWLKEAFAKYSERIGQKCSKEIIDNLSDKVRKLLERETDGTYTSFYDETAYREREPREVLTNMLLRVLLAKAKDDETTTEAILRSYLNEKYLYFPKMAFYIIGQLPDKYSKLFWEALDTDIGTSIWDKTLYVGDELKHLLNNLKDISEDQKSKLHKLIEQAAERHEFKEDAERSKALYKQQIYQALSHDPYFQSLYEELKEITNVDTVLHAAIGKVETSWGPGPSPLTKDKILKMPNQKLAAYLATFKTKDFRRGPTIGGLADLLAEVAKEAPDKFIENMDSFNDAGFLYVCKILDGIKDAWAGKKSIDWAALFQFIEAYIDRKEFWEDKYIINKGEWREGAGHEWIAGIVAEIIQDGTRNDEWAFDEKHFGQAEKIIGLLLENLKSEEDKEISDYVTYTLNTPIGKALTAFILLALRIARVNDKRGTKSEVKWAAAYKEKYNAILGTKIIEGFVCLGRYLPNLYYLDKEWVKEKIAYEKGSKYWEAFMDGYLSIGKVYDVLYHSMKPHYEFGLSYDFKVRHNREHMIQHICIGYLRGQEKLDEPESLIKKIIDTWNPEQIREIISFFWMQRAYVKEATDENEQIRAKIIEFLKLLYDWHKNRKETSLSEEDKRILSSASKLAVFLSQIDSESYKWLLLLAHYVQQGSNSSFFIEYLDELKDTGDRNETARYIGAIYLKMLEKMTPDYDKEHIRSIVDILYLNEQKEAANKICNTYGMRGYEFLRDIYENHN